MSQWQYNPELKVQFKRIWMGGLQAFLGWTPERVEDWAAHYEDDLDNRNPINLFFHEPALYYIVGMFIPTSLRDRLDGSSFVKLKSNVMISITMRGQLQPDLPDFDWDAAKVRVDELFTRYEAGLLEPDLETSLKTSKPKV